MTKKELKRRVERMDRELGEARNTISFLLRNIDIKPVVFTECDSLWASTVKVGYVYNGEYRRAESRVHDTNGIYASVEKDGKETTLIKVKRFNGIVYNLMLEKCSGRIIKLEDIEEEGANE